MTIATGSKVSIEYTLTLGDDQVVDTNVGGQPLQYTQGSSQIIPGLENALLGKEAGDSLTVKVSPEEGYGQVNEEAIIEVQTENLPLEARQVGMQVQGVSLHNSCSWKLSSGAILIMAKRADRLSKIGPLIRCRGCKIG